MIRSLYVSPVVSLAPVLWSSADDVAEYHASTSRTHNGEGYAYRKKYLEVKEGKVSIELRRQGGGDDSRRPPHVGGRGHQQGARDHVGWDDELGA